MDVFLGILIIIVCLLLMGAVLMQNPKGGGLGAGFSNIGNQVMGARRSSDLIEKATWGLAIALLVLSLATGMVSNQNKEEAKEPEFLDMAAPVEGLPPGVPIQQPAQQQ